MTPRAARLRVAATASVFVTVLAGCGVDTDDGFNQFGDGELARELVETTTTTTTTTIPVSSTTTTSPTESTASTTPTTIVQTQQVDVYYVIGDRLQSQSVALAAEVSPDQVVARLVSGPVPGDASVGLRTVVPSSLVRDVIEERGVLQVDLNGEVLDRMRERDKPLAIAQLALSLSRTILGVGQISFSRDGVPTGVPVPARDDEVSQPGEGLVFDDFAALLAATGPVSATTTAPTTTTMSPAATDPPPTEPAGTQPPAS